MWTKGEIFADAYTHRENMVTGIEARTKLAFTVAALLINLLSPSPITPLAIALFCIFTLLAIKIPPRLLLLRLALPLVTASVVLVTQVFFYGATPMFTIPVLGFHLTGYTEGLTRGILIMSRVLGGISLILLLSMSTPAHRLLLAAAWFRVPKVLVELSLLMYRYIFVLLEEVLTIRDAQRVRLGYRSWRQSMRSLAILGSSLVLRAFDRAGRVFEAMTARGYTGAMTVSYAASFQGRDYFVAGGLISLLAVFYFIGQVGA
ncbi:MAG: cobalt ECF transporter T component CbiQ [Chloroflexota bacterium]